MRCQQLALRRKEQRSVVIFFRRRYILRDTSAEHVCIRLGGEGGQGMERRGLFLRGWRGEQGFGVFGKVSGAVGGVEALRKNNQGGSCAGGFEDFGAGA